MECIFMTILVIKFCNKYNTLALMWCLESSLSQNLKVQRYYISYKMKETIKHLFERD